MPRLPNPQTLHPRPSTPRPEPCANASYMSLRPSVSFSASASHLSPTFSFSTSPPTFSFSASPSPPLPLLQVHFFPAMCNVAELDDMFRAKGLPSERYNSK